MIGIMGEMVPLRIFLKFRRDWIGASRTSHQSLPTHPCRSLVGREKRDCFAVYLVGADGSNSRAHYLDSSINKHIPKFLLDKMELNLGYVNY